MSELPKYVRDALHEVYGPVVARFTIENTPQGGAPEAIRKEWINMALPVREASMARLALGSIEFFDYIQFSRTKNEEPVGIAGIEAVHALHEAGKIEVAEFWTPYQAGEFVFRASEGVLEQTKE